MFSRRYRDYFFLTCFLHLTVLLLTRSQGEDLLMATDRQCTYIDWLTPRVTACRRLRWRERVIRDKSCNVVIGWQPQLLKKKGRNNKKRKFNWRSRLVTRNWEKVIYEDLWGGKKNLCHGSKVDDHDDRWGRMSRINYGSSGGLKAFIWIVNRMLICHFSSHRMILIHHPRKFD